MVERLLKRAETSGRADDNEETIKKRLVVFEEEVAPIVEYYKAKGKLSQVKIFHLIQGHLSEFRKGKAN